MKKKVQDFLTLLIIIALEFLDTSERHVSKTVTQCLATLCFIMANKAGSNGKVSNCFCGGFSGTVHILNTQN